MQLDDKGKHRTAPQMSATFAAAIGTLEGTLTAIVGRMEVEVTGQGWISAATASELRQVRLRAEQLLSAVPDDL